MAFSDLVAAADDAVLDHLSDGTIVYTPEIGDPVTIRGIYDEAFITQDINGGPGVETIRPAVFVRLADLPAGVDLDQDNPTIEAKGRKFEVRKRERDGVGNVVLVLREIDG